MTIRREPALLYMTLIAPLAQLILILVPGLSEAWQEVLSGVVPAVVGVLVAWLVKSEGLVPAIVGFAQSGLAALLAFGVELAADQQSAILGFVALAAGIVIRDRVVAPEPSTMPVKS